MFVHERRRRYRPPPWPLHTTPRIFFDVVFYMGLAEWLRSWIFLPYLLGILANEFIEFIPVFPDGRVGDLRRWKERRLGSGYSQFPSRNS